MNIELKDLKPIPVPVFVGGASCIGKTAVVQSLIKEDHRFIRPKSFTSRPCRAGEASDEYSFVSAGIIESMYAEGRVPTIDQVYGNLYAMETDSVHAALNSGKFPVKEIHPRNFDKLRCFFPNMISVLILRLGQEHDRVDSRSISERQQEDNEFFSRISPYAVDITLYASMDDTPEELAYLLRMKILLYSNGLYRFPRTPVIYSQNRMGYQSISEEFTEEKRITTKNFHDISAPFFHCAFATYLREGNICLELGPGQGWLRKTALPQNIAYKVLDIAPAMLMWHENCEKLLGDVAAIPLKKESCDVIA